MIRAPELYLNDPGILVISNRGYHLPIEIKLVADFERSWLRGLDAFDASHRKLGIEVPYRLVLSMGEPARPDPRTYVIPLRPSAEAS